MRKKKTLRIRSKVHETQRDGAKQPAVEPAEVLLMLQTLSRWVCYDHRHKTFLSKELIWIAARILQLIATNESRQWMLHPRWPERAFAMGIDLHTFNVVDPVKFGWFWHQLGQTGKFDIKLQRDLLNSGKEPPEIQPLIVTKPYWTPKVKIQKHHAEAVTNYQNEVRKEDIMDHFFV